MSIYFQIFLGFMFGGLIVFAALKLVGYCEGLEKRITELESQIKGRQLPYYVKDGLEEIKALENKDSFDLARMRLYLEEAIKTVDQAADRQNKMGEVYNALRNHKKRGE